MNYFEGLQIFMGHRTSACRGWVDKVFGDYWVLDYCHSGQLMYARGESAETLRRLEGPVAWTTFPGEYFRFGNPPDGPPMEWDHRFVAFKGQRAERMAGSGLFPAGVDAEPIPIESPERFRMAFDLLLDRFRSAEAMSAGLVHQLEGLLLQLHEQGRERVRISPTGQSVRQLIDRLQAAPERRWDFFEEAIQVGISYDHLRRVWRELSGSAPQAFLLRVRLEKAVELLRDPALSIKEIGWQCGFEDFSYFTRLFRQRYGLPPGKFRHEVIDREML